MLWRALQCLGAAIASQRHIAFVSPIGAHPDPHFIRPSPSTDTLFSADLTIMEEGTELLHRLTEQRTANPAEKKPMFTSCCPGWIGELGRRADSPASQKGVVLYAQWRAVLCL